MLGEKECLTVKRRMVFQALGDMAVNDLLHVETSLDLGTNSRPMLLDLRV